MLSVSRTSLALGLSIALALQGCSKSSSTQHPSDTARFAISSEPPTLDPTLAEDRESHRVLFDLFEGLVDFDQNNQPIPGLAKSWTISPDGKTYTFTLRSDIKFSDGTPITANDFIYSWQRLVSPKTGSPYSYILDNLVNGKAIIDGKMPADKLGVFAPNPTTFVVKLVNPDAVFLKICALQNLVVIPEKAIDKYGVKWTEPENMITSGAYTLKEHIINDHILLQKNPNYYNSGSVSIQNVKYLPITDINTQVASYKAGDLDMTWQAVPLDEYHELKRTYGHELHTVRQEGIAYYDFNMRLPIFKNNLKLRQALAMAIDRKVLAHDVLKDTRDPLYSVVTPTIEDGKYEKMDYPWSRMTRADQIIEAKALYKEAGYGPNKPLQLEITYHTNINEKAVTLAIASMWKDVLGVNVKVKNEEWGTFLQSKRKGDFQVISNGWIADYDSVEAYTPLFLCNSPQNNSHYCNPIYDKLIAQAEISTDPALQTNIYANALTTVRDDYAIIPIVQYSYTQLVKPYVENYDIKTNYFNHLQSKWFKLD